MKKKGAAGDGEFVFTYDMRIPRDTLRLPMDSSAESAGPEARGEHSVV